MGGDKTKTAGSIIPPLNIKKRKGIGSTQTLAWMKRETLEKLGKVKSRAS